MIPTQFFFCGRFIEAFVRRETHGCNSSRQAAFKAGQDLWRQKYQVLSVPARRTEVEKFCEDVDQWAETFETRLTGSGQWLITSKRASDGTLSSQPASAEVRTDRAFGRDVAASGSSCRRDTCNVLRAPGHPVQCRPF